MTAPLRTTSVRLARQLDIDPAVFEMLVAAGTLPGTKQRSHLYIPLKDAPGSREDVIDLVRADLIVALRKAAHAANFLMAEYEAIRNDAQVALDDLTAGVTPGALGEDLVRTRGMQRIFDQRENPMLFALNDVAGSQRKVRVLFLALHALTHEPDEPDLELAANH